MRKIPLDKNKLPKMSHDRGISPPDFSSSVGVTVLNMVGLGVAVIYTTPVGIGVLVTNTD